MVKDQMEIPAGKKRVSVPASNYPVVVMFQCHGNQDASHLSSEDARHRSTTGAAGPTTDMIYTGFLPH